VEEDGNYPHPLSDPKATFARDREYLRQILEV